jgi:hypothetical protein
MDVEKTVEFILDMQAKWKERWAKNEERWSKNEERWARAERHMDRLERFGERLVSFRLVTAPRRTGIARVPAAD